MFFYLVIHDWPSTYTNAWPTQGQTAARLGSASGGIAHHFVVIISFANHREAAADSTIAEPRS
jgi:hypothetical protein